MDQKVIKAVLGGSPYPSMGEIVSFIQAATAAERARLTPEERRLRDKQNEQSYEERLRKRQIVENICPDCEGKLVRGKKDKKHDYKRSWTCNECGNTHYV